MMNSLPAPFSIVPKKAGTKHHQGFSLIEIMVVMVIVGIILRFVVISFGDFGASRRVETSTKHLSALLKLAHTKAIIGNQTYGLRITQRGYQFYQYKINANQNKGKWASLDKVNVFKKSSFPPKTQVQLSGINRNTSPHIIISSTGSITPFTLTLSINKDSYRIQSKGNGEISIGDV